MIYGVVNQDVDAGKWEIILMACPIQISVVHAHSHFAILFRHGNNIGGPLWIGGDDQESGVELFHDFSLDLL